jgi:DNA-binding FadR family transcriptional regulator
MREQIVSGTWPVGSRIPTEPELAAAAGTGRNTIREAVQSLVHAGLLERRQGSGTYVLAKSELPTVIERQFGDASQRDVLEVRGALEQVTASLAARRRTDEQVTHLRELVAERDQCLAQEDLRRVVKADTQIHRYIAEIAGNPVLAELYATVLSAVQRNICHNFKVHADAGNTHRAMIEAITGGDPDRAAAETRAYFEKIAKEMESTQSTP